MPKQALKAFILGVLLSFLPPSLNALRNYSPIFKVNYRNAEKLANSVGYYENKGYLGAAWFLLLKNKGKFSETEENIFKLKRKALERKLRKVVKGERFSLKIENFLNYSNFAGAPSIIKDRLINFLIENFPQIKIIENPNAQTDLIIKGSINEFRVKVTTKTKNKTKNYVAGIRKIPNPRFAAVQQEVSTYCSMYAQIKDRSDQQIESGILEILDGLIREDRRTVARGFGRIGVTQITKDISGVKSMCESAKTKLNGISPYLTETETATITYREYEIIQEGTISLGTRLVSKDGEIVYAKNFYETFKHKDLFRPGVEIADVPEDPLEIYTDAEIQARLLNKITRKSKKTLEEKIKQFSLDLKRKKLNKVKNKLEKAEICGQLLYLIKTKQIGKDKKIIYTCWENF